MKLKCALMLAAIGPMAGCDGPNGPKSVCDLYVVNQECPSGTEAYNATVNAEMRSYRQCEDLGLKAGTSEFTNCNLRAVSNIQASQRSELQQEREFRLRALQAMQPAYRPQPYVIQPYVMQPLPRPTTTDCMRMGNMVSCTTN